VAKCVASIRLRGMVSLGMVMLGVVSRNLQGDTRQVRMYDESGHLSKRVSKVLAYLRVSVLRGISFGA
jgi:hypothetical protein